MRHQRSEERMFGELRLDDHLARQVRPPGPPSDLHQLCKQALGRAPVGGEKRRIGADRPDQRQLRKVVPLGQHLGADQDVGLAGVDLCAQRFPLLAALGRVAVHAQDARLWKTLGKRFFEALGAAPEGQDVLVATGRASLGHAAFEAAVMAAQAAVGEVQHQVGRAARAVGDPAAGGTAENRRVAAAVEEDQALLAACQTRADGAQQHAGQPILELLQARIDALHLRQASVLDGAFAQREQAIARWRTRVSGVGPAFERRRRRTEDDGDAQRVGTEDRHVARRIAHAVLLLERGVVLFVDDDQPQLGQRREDRETRAQHDARAAVERGTPVPRPRRIGQFAVQADQPGLGKTCRDAGFELRREVDLGHQEQGLFAGGQRAFDEAQVNLGLAAAGDPVQQIGLETGARIEGVDLSQNRALLGREFGRRRRRRPFRRPSAARLGRVDATQTGRQRRQHHLAKRCLIVVGAELAQREPVRRQARQFAADALDLAQLLKGMIARRGQVDDDADARPTAERHAHPPTDVVGGQRLAGRNAVIEDAVERNVEGDPDQLRRGPGFRRHGRRPNEVVDFGSFLQTGAKPFSIQRFPLVHISCG